MLTERFFSKLTPAETPCYGVYQADVRNREETNQQRLTRNNAKKKVFGFSFIKKETKAYYKTIFYNYSNKHTLPISYNPINQIFAGKLCLNYALMSMGIEV